MEALALFNLTDVQHLVATGGYFVLFGLLLACGLGLMLPEDIPLLLAGYFVSHPEGSPGKMHLLPAAIAAWCGILGGDCILYWLGRRYGLNITRVPIIGRHVTKGRILWAETKFAEWGIAVVAVGRMFAGVRAGMVVAAGVTRFRFIKFVVADGMAAVVSGGLFMFLGYKAGKRLGTLKEVSEHIRSGERWIFGVLLIAGIGAGIWIWYRRKRPAIVAGHPLVIDAEKIVVEQSPASALRATPAQPRAVPAEAGQVAAAREIGEPPF